MVVAEPEVVVAEPEVAVAEPEVAIAESTVRVVPPSQPVVTAWVSKPGKLTGPILGTVSLLASLEKGKPYVQVAAFATEADLAKALDSLVSYVPVSLFKAEGEKNPWRILVDAVPKPQMGVLIMAFRQQGYRTAALIRG